MLKLDKTQSFGKKISWKIWVPAAAAAILLWLLLAPPAAETIGLTYAARRGPLPISVLEGGSIEAQESQEIRSEIKASQGTKILAIVEEGYLVTEEDVKNKKVLVELDSAELKERMITQEIQFQSTLASRTEAQQAYEIQVAQNVSDIKAAEQTVRFSLMDLEKYLGNIATKEILDEAGLSPESFLTITNTPPKPGNNSTRFLQETAPAQFTASVSTVPADAPETRRPSNRGPRQPRPEPGNAAPPIVADPSLAKPLVEKPIMPKLLKRVLVDFSKFAVEEKLGDGEAKQQLRKLNDDLLLSQTEKGLAETKLEGTKRLQAKDFVTKTELDNEELAVRKAKLRVETAATALALFKKYQFPKESETLLSKYEEALLALERARKEAISKEAQSEARLRSAEGRFRIEAAQQEELREQLEKCIIRAEKSGLVVYGGGSDRRFYGGGEEQIREGATVRQRQPIITIPDMTAMAVRVKIPEAHVKRVKKGMKVKIQVDAFPEETLWGEVTKVGVLPDSQDRWLNPDLKVYSTTVQIEGVYDWVKPGMSARVEILVKELTDVISVPVQAVSPMDGKHFCFVAQRGKSERREVVIGEFNDEFIEIKEGLKEGELVLLRTPEVHKGAQSPESSAEPSAIPAAAPSVKAPSPGKS